MVTTTEQERLLFWQDHLNPASKVIELPLDFPRPAISSLNIETLTDLIDPVIYTNLEKLAEAQQTDIQTLLLTCYFVLLYRYTYQEDMIVGFQNEHLKSLLPILSYTSGEISFIRYLETIKRALKQAVYQQVPFENILKLLNIREDSRPPLVEAQLLFNDTSTTNNPPFDIRFTIKDQELNLSYNSDLFRPATMQLLLEHWRNLLISIIQNPEELLYKLPIISDEEKHKLLVTWNQSQKDYPKEFTFHQLFEQQSEKTPEFIAARFEDQSLSYQTLNERANKLAHFLLQEGLKSENVVAIMADRDLDFLTGMIGIFKAGGAYLPLDPRYPSQRIRQVLSTSMTRIVLVADHYVDTLQEALDQADDLDVMAVPFSLVSILNRHDLSIENPQIQVKPEDLAYIIFTSGSTGLPKGAQVEHRGMVNHLYAKIFDLELSKTDIVAQNAPQSFVVSVWQFLAALVVGAQTRIYSIEVANMPDELIQQVAEHQISILEVVPSIMRVMIEAIQSKETNIALPHLRWLMPTGEALPPTLVRQWLGAYPHVPLINAYGTTECSDDVIHYPIYEPPAPYVANMPIGKPVANMRMYILDKFMEPVPTGVMGELYVGGIGVGRGYINDPERTSAAFMADPFEDEAPARFYKTGDLARYLPDGTIEYLGRVDFQVKVNGIRIELKEIEVALESHPLIKESIVTLYDRHNGQKHLCAYIIPADEDSNVTIAALSNYLKQHIPAYMVPSAFVTMDEMPLTPNGKINRKALPKPDPSQQITLEDVVEASTEIEKQLAIWWKSLIGLSQVGIYNDFFELGGDSLQATRLVTLIRNTYGFQFKLDEIFTKRTIAEQASSIQESILSNQTNWVTKDIVPVVRNENGMPISNAQERLWILDQLGELGATYNLPYQIHFNGKLNIAILEASINEIIAQQESLRTRFGSLDGTAIQIVEAPFELKLDLLDLSNLSEEQQIQQISEQSQDEAGYRFDLSKDRLFHFKLIRLSNEHHILLLNLHHIIADGWSTDILINHLSTAYKNLSKNKAAKLPELAIQYMDYSEWHHDYLSSGILEEQVQFWIAHLSDAPPTLDFPTDYPRPKEQTISGDIYEFTIPEAIVSQIKSLTQQNQVTAYMTYLSLFYILLYRYSGQSDIVLGTPHANRSHPDLEYLIGFFVNTLVLRTELAGNPTFIELLERVKETTLNAFSNADVPFQALVEVLNPSRDPSYSPIFQHMFSWEDNPMPDQQIGNLTIHTEEIYTGTAMFDLTMVLVDRGDKIEARLEYNVDLFSKQRIEMMANHFLRLAEGITQNPAQKIHSLSMLSDTEIHQQLHVWNQTSTDYPLDESMVSIFEKVVTLYPDHLAVISEDGNLTYAELNQKANQLAHLIVKQGIQKEEFIGIALSRKPHLIVSLLAILKAGGAYVPLDPQYPRERLEYMISDANLALIITEKENKSHLPVSQEVLMVIDEMDEQLTRASITNLNLDIDCHNLAYVIYTSGSTGNPKGVQIEHRSLINYAHAAKDKYEISPNTRFLQFSSINFDASAEEIWAPLISGGIIVLRTDEMSESMLRFIEKCEEWDIDIAGLPTAFWHELVNTMESQHIRLPKSIKRFIIGGERAKPELVATWHHLINNRIELINSYGPTEATIGITMHIVDSSIQANDDRIEVPLGRPIPNSKIYLLDAEGQLVPAGALGEIHAGGECLARAYLNRPDLTLERFVKDPFDQEGRLYKTGDLGQYLPDGKIQFHGRRDDQVKIRGFRIELTGIESAISKHPNVIQTIVLVKQDRTANPHIIAYVQHQPGLDFENLNQFLNQQLPAYMIPSFYISIREVPITPGGKVNKRALPEPDWTQLSATNEFVAPTTELETYIAEAWQSLLSIEQIGITDHFFELGGKSLIAARFITKVENDLGARIRLTDLFNNPTVGSLAKHLEGSVNLENTARQISIIKRDKPIMQSDAQERLWILDQLGALGPTYNLPHKILLRGNLNIETLEKSLDTVISHHESLRTRFKMENGVPIQIILPSMALEIPHLDLSHLSEDALEESIDRECTEFAQYVFNLTNEALIRAKLLKISEREHLLLLNLHHIIVDGWSMDIFMEDWAQAYHSIEKGEEPQLKESPIQYADYSIWQRKELESERLKEQLSYWQSKLAGAPATLEFPTDYPRPKEQSIHGARIEFEIPSKLRNALFRISQDHQTTLYTLCLAAFYTLLYRHSGQEDILVGTPHANRSHPDLERVIGFFVNTLVLRTDLSGNPTFAELLSRVRETSLEAFSNEQVPFQILVDALKPERSASYTPFFQHMFTWLDEPIMEQNLGDLEAFTDEIFTHATMFDMVLSISDFGNYGHGRLEYNTDLFTEERMQRFVQHYQRILQTIADNTAIALHEIEILSDEEVDEQLYQWAGQEIAYPVDKTISQLFEEQVEKSASNLAVFSEYGQLSYQELNQQANQLARYLQQKGITRENIVGVSLPRVPQLIIALLAIQKAGAAYLPLDPTYPADRLLHMIEDSDTKLILTLSSLSERLPKTHSEIIALDVIQDTLSHLDDQNLRLEQHPEQLINIIYTSGSTGKPKGVMVEQRQMVNYILAYNRYCEMNAQDRQLQFMSINFDPSGSEIFSTLLSGARLYLRTDEMSESILTLLQKCAEWEITSLTFPAAFWHEVSNALTSKRINLPKSLRIVSGGGERINPELVANWYQYAPENIRLLNAYGPTETTIAITMHDINTRLYKENPAQDVPIGKPLDNMYVRILDPHGKLLPSGAIGELHIGGKGITRGYLNQPVKTAEVFVKDPYDPTGQKLIYRSGDLAKYRNDGTIMFLGRRDDQVKIRGFRIELGEIETVLSQLAGLENAVVMVKQDPAQNQHLVAYYKESHALEQGDIIQYMDEHLPYYMIPTRFVRLDHMPITPNGKIDKKALPEPDWSERLSEVKFIQPKQGLEELLASLWQELLGIEQVGAVDNFFELGGKSLTAARFATQLEMKTGKNIRLAELFQYPTVRKLSAYLEGAVVETSTTSPYLIPIHIGKEDRTPFFWLHSSDFTNLKPSLDDSIPFYCVLPSGVEAGEPILTSVNDIVEHHLQAIRSMQPHGPYVLGGYCNGGLNAFAIAQRLIDEGEEVQLLALVSMDPPDELRQQGDDRSFIERLQKSIKKGRLFKGIQERIEARLERVTTKIADERTQRLQEVVAAHDKTFLSYLTDKVYTGKVALFESRTTYEESGELFKNRWDHITDQAYEIHIVPGNHESMIQQPNSQILGSQLNEVLLKTYQELES